MNRPPHISLVPAARRGGFTLLELMISIALVLILILGVNTVFSMTAQTVSAGSALGTIYRANQSFHGVIYQDLKSMVVGTDAPCFVIVNQRRNAWRNAADREADKDGRQDTYDFNGDGTEDPTRETIGIGTYNFRNHRIDKLCFFARGKFYRQTGSGGRFWDGDPSNLSRPLSSDEAWIKYGFLALPDNNPTNPIYLPPADTNPARNNPQANPNNYYSTQWVLGRNVTLLVNDTVPPFPGGVYGDTGANPLEPLDPDTQARQESGEQFQFNRYDVVVARMNQSVGGRDSLRAKVAKLPANSGNFKERYWNLLGDFYFRGNNMVTRPIDPASVSRALPIFVPGASQFCVEYTGDFVGQNATGVATSRGADGVADYMVDAAGIPRVRWYGFPRDVDGDGVIDRRYDVVPVSETFNGSPTLFPWERLRDASRYIVGWGADQATLDEPRPTMLRVTLVVDDGRLAGGETFEFVGKVQ